MGVSSVFLHGTSPPASAVLPRRFFAVILLYTLAYDWVMATFEGKERGFFESLLMVVETFTTTGYGEDADWQSPATILLVISMMFTGVFFIFMALPLFVVPWIEERLSTTPPTSIPGLTDHVVICTYTDRSETLVEELDVVDVDYVVVEPDRELATELFEDGVSVIHGDPESVEDLEAANLAESRALVADFDDETNASISLAAGQVVEGDGVQIITFVEDPDLADYHRYAGADTVFSPRHLIGESLANKVTTGLTSEVADAVGSPTTSRSRNFQSSRGVGSPASPSPRKRDPGTHGRPHHRCVVPRRVRDAAIAERPHRRADDSPRRRPGPPTGDAQGDDSLGDQAEPPRVGRRRRLRRGRVDRQTGHLGGGVRLSRRRRRGPHRRRRRR